MSEGFACETRANKNSLLNRIQHKDFKLAIFFFMIASVVYRSIICLFFFFTKYKNSRENQKPTVVRVHGSKQITRDVIVTYVL